MSQYSGASAIENFSYTYSPITGQRMTLVDWGSISAQTQLFVYDPITGNPLLVLNSSGTVTEHDAPGQQLGQTMDVDGSWIISSDIGPVTDVISGDGVVFSHTVYDAYGNIESWSTAPATRFGYRGMVFDVATNLYDDNLRFYDPEQGAFITQDPTGFGGGDYNLYRYVGNDPVRNTDPSGLAVITVSGTENWPSPTSAPGYSPNYAVFLGGSSPSTSTSGPASPPLDVLAEVPPADFPLGREFGGSPLIPDKATVRAFQAAYLAWLNREIDNTTRERYRYALEESGLRGAGAVILASQRFRSDDHLDCNAGQLVHLASVVVGGDDNLESTIEATKWGVKGAELGLAAAPIVLSVGSGSAVALGFGETSGLLGAVGGESLTATELAGGEFTYGAAAYVRKTSCFRTGTKIRVDGSLRAIETIRLGQRVATPGIQQNPSTVDPVSHRIVHLHFVKDGQEFHLSFLRHARMLENIGIGDTMSLGVSELHITGSARVTGIEPCPAIEDGPGRIVTGIFRSESYDMRRIKLVGLDEPIDITAGHAVFSEDHQDFVAAKVLQPRVKVRTIDGVAVIESNVHLPERCEVFNLEIDGAHQYYVTERSVLVHNADGDCLFGLVGSNAELAQGEVPFGTSFDLEHHNMTSSLYRDNELVSQRQWVSGCDSNEYALGRQQGLSQPWRTGDTESRALRAIELQQDDLLVFHGQWAPCPWCQQLMADQAAATGAEIQYHFLDNAGNQSIWSAQQGGYIYYGGH